MDLNADMLRGHIDTIILLSLTDGDKDTNEIRQRIEEKSENKYSVKQGTFYSAMQRLVKQQLIKEYRSSSNDGIRRKYFSLTDKGSNFLENNRQEWQKSKELLDTLIDDEPKNDSAEPIILSEKDFPIPPVDTFYQHEENDDISDEVNTENINENTVDMYSAVEIPTKTVDISPQINEAYNAPEVTPKKDKRYPFEIKDDGLYVKDETNFEPTIEITVQRDDGVIPPDHDVNTLEINDIIEENSFEDTVLSDENVSVVEPHEETPTADNLTVEEIATPEPVYVEEEQPAPKINEKDDLLSVDGGNAANRREYKSILSALFPKDVPVINEVVTETDNRVSQERIEENVSDYSTYEPYIEHEEPDEPVYETKEKIVKAEPPYTSSGVTDFSDLYAMAKREGFKIKASYNTNKFSGNKILINKLNCHSAFISFLLLFLQMLLLNVYVGPIVGWSDNVKLVLVAVAAVFPLLAFFVYALNHARSVKAVTPFKDVIEIALIIAFQLTIIILCVALFVSIDFGDFKSVTEYILLPFILILNIPLFFIIKYVLLGTGKYFENGGKRKSKRV